MIPVIYPGSFDPITNGHLDIIKRAVAVFGELTVLVANNPKKKGMFEVPDRIELIKAAVDHSPAVKVDTFQGLLVDYARQTGTRVVIRGLRAVADFEFEGQMAGMNRYLNPDLETFFMMTSADNFFVSSSLVREVAALGGDVGPHVPPVVEAALKTRFSG